MNIFKALFGGKIETPEEKKNADEEKRFDLFKYDGVRALKAGQVEFSISCFREALALKNDPEVLDYLSRALIRSNELQEAYSVLQKLVEYESDNERVYLLMSHVAFMMEDYDAMAESASRVLELKPDNPLGYYSYAQSKVGQGDMISAVAMLSKALALDAGYHDALLLRGQVLRKLGDSNGALADAGRILESNADSEDALMLKARCLSETGLSAEAVETYGRVIELNPFCVDAFRERGEIKYRSGDMAGAEADMRSVLELDPEKVADVSGEFSAEGVEHKTREAYRNINPLGL